MPRIIVKQNDRIIDQYVVEPGAFRVGRTPDNDIVLNDPSVSRSHLELKIDEQKVTVSDLGSSNGTYVNGIKITRIISSKASIGVGVYTLDIVGLGQDNPPAEVPKARSEDVEATMMMPSSSSGNFPGQPAGHVGSTPSSIKTKPDRPSPVGSPGGLPWTPGGPPRMPGRPTEPERKQGWLGRLFGKK